MIADSLKLVFGLRLTHLKNAKDLENVHIKGIGNNSGIKYNMIKSCVIKI